MKPKRLNLTNLWTITDGVDALGTPVLIPPSRVICETVGMGTLSMLVDSGSLFIGKRAAKRAYDARREGPRR